MFLTCRFIAVIMLLLGFAPRGVAQAPIKVDQRPPEFTDVEEWINSKPLKLAELKGKVVVAHFYAFG